MVSTRNLSCCTLPHAEELPDREGQLGATQLLMEEWNVNHLSRPWRRPLLRVLVLALAVAAAPLPVLAGEPAPPSGHLKASIQKVVAKEIATRGEGSRGPFGAVERRRTTTDLGSSSFFKSKAGIITLVVDGRRSGLRRLLDQQRPREVTRRSRRRPHHEAHVDSSGDPPRARRDDRLRAVADRHDRRARSSTNRARVLPGVTVTLMGKQGAMPTVTDERGEFRFVGLNPGTLRRQGRTGRLRAADGDRHGRRHRPHR